MAEVQKKPVKIVETVLRDAHQLQRWDDLLSAAMCRYM